MSSEHEASANGPRGPLAEDATARAPAAVPPDFMMITGFTAELAAKVRFLP